MLQAVPRAALPLLLRHMRFLFPLARIPADRSVSLRTAVGKVLLDGDDDIQRIVQTDIGDTEAALAQNSADGISAADHGTGR